MKILFIGEYSNLPATLAEGLKALGHEAVVISDGTKWRNYRRDINLHRNGISRWSGIKYMASIAALLPRMRGYDVVQLINPDFVWLKAERQRLLFDYLKRHNKKIFIGAFGYDWYWVDAGLNKRQFEYGDFYIGNRLRTDEPKVKQFIAEWINTPKGDYCRYVMEQCDGIPACLYEYQVCYSSYFPQKTRFIPLPIICEHTVPVHEHRPSTPIRFFIGIDTSRSQFKGTDVMYEALLEAKQKYPSQCEIVKAECLPFDEYQQMMDSCDCILDQLYSYTPAMNALHAMDKGLVCIGGGEPENYEIIGEKEFRPIINVKPSKESVFQAIENIILHPEQLPELKRQSIEYVKRHHHYKKVAQAYVDFYRSIL